MIAGFVARDEPRNVKFWYNLVFHVWRCDMAGTTIVVGIDFSPTSRVALAQAVRLGEARRATVRVVHVIETLAVLPLTDELSAFQVQVAGTLIDDAKASWQAWCKEQPAWSALPFHVEINNPAGALAEYCRAHRADLLVMGSHGSGSGAHGAGLVARSCVRRSPCDVLLVQDWQRGKFARVLACVDFSPTSKKAVERALELAALDGASVDVLTVYTPVWERVKPRPGGPEANAAFIASYEKALLERLEAFCVPGPADSPSGALAAWAKPRAHVVADHHHARAIAQQAQLLGADAVVIGTRGSSNLHDMILGSTAERVLRDAHRSILAVRPRAQA